MTKDSQPNTKEKSRTDKEANKKGRMADSRTGSQIDRETGKQPLSNNDKRKQERQADTKQT